LHQRVIDARFGSARLQIHSALWNNASLREGCLPVGQKTALIINHICREEVWSSLGGAKELSTDIQLDLRLQDDRKNHRRIAQEVKKYLQPAALYSVCIPPSLFH